MHKAACYSYLGRFERCAYSGLYTSGTLRCFRKAHSHAFEVGKVLHCDISVGNIILTDEGRGLLIDWELAKNVAEVRARRPDCTVSHPAQYPSTTH